MTDLEDNPSKLQADYLEKSIFQLDNMIALFGYTLMERGLSPKQHKAREQLKAAQGALIEVLKEAAPPDQVAKVMEGLEMHHRILSNFAAMKLEKRKRKQES